MAGMLPLTPGQRVDSMHAAANRTYVFNVDGIGHRMKPGNPSQKANHSVSSATPFGANMKHLRTFPEE